MGRLDEQLVGAEPIKVHGPIGFVYDDGGRAAAGRKGDTRDCVVRAIAIATGRPYGWVYDEINAAAATERPRTRKRSNARTGVQRTTWQPYIEGFGWKWVPTMKVGAGCKVHLRASELPPGRLIVRVSRHMCAVIDGVIHDTHDPSRDGQRCVYGYFQESAALAGIRAGFDRIEKLDTRLAAVRFAATPEPRR
jgi:hypothetical protein